MAMAKERIDALRSASGTVTYSDPLTTFFYLLMRNELATGTVAELVEEVVNDHGEEIIFTNGWLAKYANYLADQITNAKTIRMQKDLDKVFEDKACDLAKLEQKKGEEIKQSHVKETFD
jgi:hypothetical protein